MNIGKGPSYKVWERFQPLIIVIKLQLLKIKPNIVPVLKTSTYRGEYYYIRHDNNIWNGICCKSLFN